MSPENIAPPDSPAVTCPGWAPGLDIPDGECVHCHVHKRDHPKHLQSRASGVVTGISPAEFRLADSPLATHPSMISPASSAAKVRPDVCFCRWCNQGMVIAGVESGSQAETDYACPKCGNSGPKSKTPTGKVHAETHEMPVPDKTMKQRAFEDGASGGKPVASITPGTVGYDPEYAEWYSEGRKRYEAGADAANAAHAASREPEPIDAEIEDVPAHETVTYADGSTATGPGPLPRTGTDGAAAIAVDGVPVEQVDERIGDAEAREKENL